MDKHLDPETRRHPVAGGLDTIPPDANERGAAARKWLMPLAGFGVGAILVGTMAFVYRLGVDHGTPKVVVASMSPSAAPSAASTRVLLLDPVCRKAVDPTTAPAVLDFGGKSIYFDSLDCLNAFRTDPVKYGAGRIRVHIAPNPEESSSPAVDDTASPAGGAPLEETAPAPDGQSNGDAPPNGETLDDAPAGGAPPNGESLDEPGGGTTTEAPPAVEPPAKKPKPGPKAPAKPPRSEPPADGEFSLPPELKEGPPPRRPGGKPAPAATEGPPPVDEAPPTQ